MKHDVTCDILMCVLMGFGIGIFASLLCEDIKYNSASVPDIIMQAIMLLIVIIFAIYYVYLTIFLINKKLNKRDDSKGDDEK